MINITVSFSVLKWPMLPSAMESRHIKNSLNHKDTAPTLHMVVHTLDRNCFMYFVAAKGTH